MTELQKHPIARLALVMLLASTLSTIRSTAQDNLIAPFSSVIGNITGAQSETWTFNAIAGEVVSFIVSSTDGLDTVLTLQTETGAQLTTSDDYDYPNSTDSILQAVTMPFTGTYTVIVSGYGDTSGSYTLTRLRGYAEGFHLNDFSDNARWVVTNNMTTVRSTTQAVSLSMTEADSVAIVTDESSQLTRDAYAEITVNVSPNQENWTVYFTTRQQSENTFYALAVDSRGRWRFSKSINGEETVLRDWSTHPAIRAGNRTFSMGLMTNHSGIDVFYDAALLGQIIDTSIPAGVIGFGIGTPSGITPDLEASFTDLNVTIPSQADIIPEQLILGDAATITRELERQRMIAPGGELTLNVPESVAQSIDVGVSRLPLGRGATFARFVFSTDVVIQSNEPSPSACGLFVHGTDDTDYIVAYLEQDGHYGLSRRTGDTFENNIYDSYPDYQERGKYNLILISNGTQLTYYIDGHYVGAITGDMDAGLVGNAAINFEPNTTFCNYTNTWLWNWSKSES